MSLLTLFDIKKRFTDLTRQTDFSDSLCIVKLNLFTEEWKFVCVWYRFHTFILQ